MTRKKTPRHRMSARAFALVALVLTALPATAARRGDDRAILARTEIPAGQLLDVAVQVMGDGVPPGAERELEDEGLFLEVRRSEARYISVHLMDTLQTTGQWGAVRVVPEGADSMMDVTVSGTIVESTGGELVLELRAVDARRHVWFDRKYKEDADLAAYGDDPLGPREPFQRLYNAVANDLLEAKRELDADEVREIRTVNRLRFAAELAPAAFDDYLSTDRRGRLQIERLPAEGDPMMARVENIRLRDELFVDTLNEHYANFYARMAPPYEELRHFSYEELEARKKLRRKATAKKVLGALAILGGLLSEPDNYGEATAREAAVIGGVMAIQSGIGDSQEAKLHVESLRELGSSFKAEVTPMLVDVEGQTRRLSGSAEAQYAQWRELLHEIFVEETGLPADPNESRTGADTSRR